MHIAVDVRSLMEGRQSGVEEYTAKILDAMSQVGPRNIYHAFYNSAQAVQLPVFRKNVVIHGSRYPNKVLGALQWATNHPRWDSFVEADVFFVPNPRLMPLSPEKPVVSVAHDLSFERFPEFLNWRRRLWHRAMRPRALFQSSNHIIAVSEHTKEDLVRLYNIPEEKISVVYSGVSIAEPPSAVEVEQLKKELGLPEKFVLYLGTFEPRKNIEGIIRSYSAIAHEVPQQLVIAGESGWRQRGIEEAISSSSAKDSIHAINFIPETQKAALFAAADLFVYPSFYEGFGFPPLESLMCGTPVVTSFNSSLPEVVGEWVTMIDPYKTQQLAAVLRELLHSPSRVPRGVQAEVKEKYSWNKAAERTLQILETVS